MKEPDKLYLQPEVTFDPNNIFGHRNSYDMEYIRKDVVDETINSAEDHAYFAGQEQFREKLLEWVKNKITEAEIAMDTADDPAIWGQRNAFKQVLDKLNSI